MHKNTCKFIFFISRHLLRYNPSTHVTQQPAHKKNNAFYQSHTSIFFNSMANSYVSPKTNLSGLEKLKDPMNTKWKWKEDNKDEQGIGGRTRWENVM
jgi:hypothetical protein